MVHAKLRERRRDTCPKQHACGDEEETAPSNIMFDRRVIRGNTYAPRIFTTQRPSKFNASVEKQPKRKTPSPLQQDGTSGKSTPFPVEGRHHIDIQTDELYEELTDGFPVADGATQTDAFLDRPPTPLFIPKKTGTDVHTQIFPGELFDFDYEVEPLVAFLVGKTLEQSLVELHDEQERAAIRQHREEMQQRRHAELAEVQKMEAVEKRRFEEKERRLEQERQRKKTDDARRRRVAAGVYARGCLNGIVKDVFTRLEAEGHFRDPVKEDVENAFLPWMYSKAMHDVHARHALKAVMYGIVSAAVEQRRQEYDTRRAAHCAAVADELRLREQEKRETEEKETQFRQILQLHATSLLQQTDPEFISPELVESTRETLKTRGTTSLDEVRISLLGVPPQATVSSKGKAEDDVTDTDVILELIRAGHLTQPSVEEAVTN